MRLSLLAVLALFCAIRSEGREIRRRVEFKRGETEVTIAGRIPSAGDSVVCELSVRAGQRLSIRLKPGKNLVAQVVLIFPSGKQDGPGAELSRIVEESGTVHIRVTPRQQTAGSFRLHLSTR